MSRGMLRCLVATALCLAAVSAQRTAVAADDLDGVWVAQVSPPVGKSIRLVLRVEKAANGVLEATLDTPEQELFGLEVDNLERDGNQVRFGCKLVKATFTGTLDDAKSKIDGTWKQGLPMQVSFVKTDPTEVPPGPVVAVPAGLPALLTGKLALPSGIELNLVLRTATSASGKKRVVFDVPDQQAAGIPLSALALGDEGELTFEIKLIKASFTGKRNADGTAFEGTFHQGVKLPLTLRAVEKVEEARRPQNPEPPFPYVAEDVQYRNEPAGITLAGTLTMPAGDGPFPAVLLITGSGAQDRDEALLGHKPFLVLADYLTRRGLAVLRVDDRGVGGSSGNTQQSTTDDFAGDALAGVAFLRAHPRVDPGHIGLVGHSEGGLIGPLAASRSSDVAFVVMLAGTGVPGIDVLELQGQRIAEAMGVSPQAVALQSKMLRSLHAVLQQDLPAEERETKLAEAVKGQLAELSAEDRKLLELNEGDDEETMVRSSLASIDTPWFLYFLKYDPREALRRLKCPVLVLNGEKDLQVLPDQNLPEIEKALREAGNTRFVIKRLPGLNHLFQTAQTGAPAEYGKIEETMSPIALEAIGDWLLQQAAR